MSGASDRRGAATVGHLGDLEAIEAGAVLCLRACHFGKLKPDRARHGLTGALGFDLERAAFDSIEEICELCAQYGRRPLMCHGLGCACLGADEACMARLVAAASEGAREDATLIAVLLVRADVAPYLVTAAENLGLAMRRLDHLLATQAPASVH